MSEDDIKRFTTDDGRVYVTPDDTYLPSVSTVLGQMDEPEGIKKWKSRNDGTGSSKHWRDILTYKANRGTLIHYKLLNQLIDGDMYGVEEENSKDELKENGNWGRYEDDLDFAKEAWEEIKQQRGITPDSILDIECFVTNKSIGYAGQFDLLYVDNNGDLVLADLKTSKGVYDKHMMQLTAYQKSVNLDIDVLEIIRIHPDSKSWEIAQEGPDWYGGYFIDFENQDQVWAKFLELRQSMTGLEDDMEQIVENGLKEE